MVNVVQEELRPNTFDEFQGLNRKPTGNLTEKEILIDLFRKDRAMCLLFLGPPGTGKTSFARLLAKDYLGEHFHAKFKTYNASVEVGVKTVRGEFVEFCGSEDESGLRNIVFLDEADGVKWQAQDALRAVIEKYSWNTIFILGANRKYRFHEALISRSTLFHFDKLSINDTIKWFNWAADKCEMNIASDIPRKVLSYYKGDLRAVVNNFFTKFYGQDVLEWHPKPTHAQEIFEADNPVEKWKNLASETYIEPIELLHRIFELHEEKDAKTFSEACDRILNGGDLTINMIMALQCL